MQFYAVDHESKIVMIVIFFLNITLGVKITCARFLFGLQDDRVWFMTILSIFNLAIYFLFYPCFVHFIILLGFGFAD